MTAANCRAAAVTSEKGISQQLIAITKRCGVFEELFCSRGTSAEGAERLLCAEFQAFDT